MLVNVVYSYTKEVMHELIAIIRKICLQHRHVVTLNSMLFSMTVIEPCLTCRSV